MLENRIDPNILALCLFGLVAAVIIYEGLAYVSRSLGEHSSVMLMALSRARVQEDDGK